jgi:hypothetical protein
MSQTNNFESADVPSVTGSLANAAHDARQNLSSEFVANAAKALIGTIGGDSNPPASPSGKSALAGILEAANGAQSPSEAPSSIGDAMRKAGQHAHNEIKDRGSLQSSDIAKEIGNHLSRYKFDITDKDRANAKDQLAKGLSDLIPDADKALIKKMQAAVIDGNVGEMKAALKELANDPAKLEKYLKALNGQLDGVELTQDSKGNVLMYEKGSNTAVSINPTTGETTLRAIERQPDGSVLLKAGEIINRQVATVMRSIGDEATRNIVSPYNKFDWRDRIMPLDGGSHGGKSGSGGGGGGGGGGDSTSPLPNKLKDFLQPGEKKFGK